MKFDFKISVDNHIVAVAPGKQISIHVRLEPLHGNPQLVNLDVNTRWESMGLSATVIPSALDPNKWQATMIIRASPTTPPGSYLFTVRGSTEGTFKTSEDAVTVIVDPKAEQREDEQDNIQPKQAEQSVSADVPAPSVGQPSPSLDNLFAPKAEGKAPVVKKMVPKGNFGITLFLVFVGLVIFFIILAKSGIFDGGRGACPASAPIDCGGGCCPAGDGGRTDVCCPGDKCTSNGKCGSSTPVNPGGCPPLDCGERGLGGAVPKQCPCPPGCPYESVTSLPGYKQCSSFR